MQLVQEASLQTAGEAVRSYVVHGAETECDMGSSKSLLVIPCSHGVYLKGQPQLNIMDYKPIINILPFGACKKLRGPCQPAVTSPWIGGKEDVFIEGALALINTCTNTCAVGGKIKITNDGQE